jgi:choline dehydrogenase-like flavoprotein
MVIDTRALAPGRELHYDVCIVGAGAAGITIARALQSDHRRVALLESGGFEFDDRTQSLYRGITEATGLNHDRYLIASRLRFFGGTTHHWAGMCRPLDPSDFAIRPWVPNSGWPIGLDDLAPYYTRAADILQFRPFDEQWGNVSLGPGSLVPPGGALIGRTFRYSPPTRFGRVYRRELVEAKTVDVLLHANLVHIDVNEAGTTVERLQVATLGGRRLTVRAPIIVLATGGVENARLLLVSNNVHKAGLGNACDCVGRYFMEHPERTVAYMAITSQSILDDLQQLRRSRAMLCLSEESQRTHELLNTNIEFGTMNTLRESPAGGTPLAIRDTLNLVDSLGSPEPPEEDPTRSRVYRRAFIRAEAAPLRESRVTLADRDTDALGLRRPHLAFVMDTLQSRTFVRTMEVVARELGARQGGRVILRLAEEAVDIPVAGPLWGGVGGGNHHMGTTRMSDRPEEGVVDRHCRVHGVSNLYVAGSSVFPTGGMANPTFTIVALALRIADHVADTLGGS